MPDDAGLAVGLATASIVLPTALVTAKYWCGFAIALAEPAVALVERDEAVHQLQEPLLVEEPVQGDLEPGEPVAPSSPSASAAQGDAVVVDVPRRVVVERRERRAVARGDAIADQVSTQNRNADRELAEVRLQLRVRRAPDPRARPRRSSARGC